MSSATESVAPDRPVWIFGYGSLVSPTSMARTIGRVAVRGENFFAASLHGYGRRWNYGALHVAGTWTLSGGATTEDGVIVALGLTESPTERVNGIVASIAATELPRLDRRERSYDRVDISDRVTVLDEHDGAVSGPIYTYVPRSAAIEHYLSARDRGLAGVRRTYWELVDEAFAELGNAHSVEYRATPTPDVPIVDVLDARER